MYNSLTGMVTFKDRERLHLALAGVEWDLAISGSTADALPESGSEARVFTFLHHREDVMKLYGFASAAERELFLSPATGQRRRAAPDHAHAVGGHRTRHPRRRAGR